MSPTETAPVELSLDPDAVRRQKARRARRLHLVHIPALRAAGLAVVVVLVWAHNLRTGAAPWAAALRLGIGLAAYATLSWAALALLWRRGRAIDLGALFLALDFLPLTAAIYASGGERSWLFFLPLVQVGNQAATTFRRVLVFAHLAPLSYLLLLAWLRLGEGRAIAWEQESAKIAGMYALGMFVSMSARTAQRLRERTAAAVRLCREQALRLLEQSRQLEAARDRAEEASRAKGQFLANMSHEIRTPLNGILGMAELALAAGSTPEQRECVETMHASASTLLGIVNHVLDFSRLEAGHMILQEAPFSVRGTLDRVLRDHAPAARAKGLRLHGRAGPRVPEVVVGDAARLRQVLDSLVDNAIKFTDSGVVALRIELAEQDRDSARLHFSVRDTGIGIAPNKIEEVLQPFVQEDGSNSRRYGGAGLGLSVSRLLVERMGGFLALQSAPGRGTRVTFSARFGAAAQPATGAPARSRPVPLRPAAPPTPPGSPARRAPSSP